MSPYIVIWLAALVLYGLLLVLLRIDWTPGRYKVIFHDGPEVGIKIKGSSGWLSIDGDQLKIAGTREVTLALGSVLTVELFRLYGLGRMIRITHTHGTLFVTVVRFCIAGRLATVDFFKTKRLLTVLSSHLESRTPVL